MSTPEVREDDHAAAVDAEICVLQARLDALRKKYRSEPPGAAPQRDSSLHNLLLLSDSALPLGAFAFSAGLESFLAHTSKHKSAQSLERFRHFLSLSIKSVAAFTLPYVHNAWINPEDLSQLDNDLEASTTCTVNKRASVAQGRALVTMWQRSLRKQLSITCSRHLQAHSALTQLSDALVSFGTSQGPQHVSDWVREPEAHFAPVFGVVAAAMNIPLQQTLYVYLFSHVKMISSAAVRASISGPYQAQALLASDFVKFRVARLVDDQVTKSKTTEDAGQTVPAMDVWSGRHELVYSRIFNS